MSYKNQDEQFLKLVDLLFATSENLTSHLLNSANGQYPSDNMKKMSLTGLFQQMWREGQCDGVSTWKT